MYQIDSYLLVSFVDAKTKLDHPVDSLRVHGRLLRVWQIVKRLIDENANRYWKLVERH